MPSATCYDVAVVGAGPAGSLCAARLAARGYHVLLLDENPETRTRIICTGITGAEAFDRFGLSTSSVLSDIRRARFVSPGGVTLGYETPGPFAYVVDRYAMDGALQQRAALQGAEMRFDLRVEGIEQLATGMRLRCRSLGGVIQMDSRVAVFATGYNQRMARMLQLGGPQRFIQGVQAEAVVSDLADAEVYFGNHIAPGFFAWVVPIGDRRARVGLLVSRDGQKYFRRFLRRVLGDRLQQEPERIMGRPIVQGALPRTAGDHFLVVGEAAGQVKTSTAGGIYYGLLCAELAAEVIHQALQKGDTRRKSLMPYQRRWEKTLGPELKAGFLLQRLGAVLSDPEIDRIFEVIGTNGLQYGLQQRIHFDWHRLSILYLIRHLRLLDLVPKALHRDLIQKLASAIAG